MIHKVNLASGATQRLCEGYAPSWSAKGDKIALLRDKGDLYVVPASGGNAEKLAEGRVWTDDSRLAWSPDGRYVAFQKVAQWAATGPRTGSWLFCGDVYLAEPASGEVRRLTRFKEVFPNDWYQLNPRVYGWTPDGKNVVIACPEVGEYPAGVVGIDVTGGEATLLLERTSFVCLSPDGKRLVGAVYRKDPPRSRDFEEFIVEGILADRHVRTIAPADRIWRLTVSWPQRLAVGAGRTGAGRQSGYKLTLFHLDGGTQRILTKGDVYEAAPACSPDGSLVAFYRHANGQSHLYVMRPDGTQSRLVASSQE
ncbi:hypothetical protein AMK68_00365 [candidate division KD3-62 bacterium DG_56]|uniref:Dipeptidylpeptidase IV N-terminal domain-containing protein n=1 Tax=candidate division KD3-62 bacterium DG_56 TaxID=1704032 RepID=A0A0S7XQS8_9BACT|nr:MAG: hypothetical protein AMK68_00365 [candidate division KD3-62 bacterium DG_56]